MSSRYTSIYLPREIKRQVIEVAQSEGFEVSCGRKSGLAKFVKTMLQEYQLLSQNDPVVSSLHSLTPDLRSCVIKLSKVSEKQQNRICSILKILLSDEDQVQEITDS